MAVAAVEAAMAAVAAVAAIPRGALEAAMAALGCQLLRGQRVGPKWLRTTCSQKGCTSRVGGLAIVDRNNGGSGALQMGLTDWEWD